MKKLKKETIDATMKSIRNLFRLKKENYAIKDMILRHTRNYFRLEKEYKTIKKI